jgi:hypothetical protein
VATEIEALSTVLNNVNSLYTNLVTYTIGLMMFAGAFVPTVISFFNNRQLKQELADLKKQMVQELHDKTREAETRLENSLKETQQTEIDELKRLNQEQKKELMKEIGVVRAGTYHIQAREAKPHPHICLPSCAWAIRLYLEGDDERNARAVISIAKGALATTTKNQLDEEEEIEQSVEKILKILEEQNINGRYEHEISAVKIRLKAAKQRVEQLEAAQEEA